MTWRIATIGILSHSFLLKRPFFDKQPGVAEESPNDSDITRIAHIEGRALACKTHEILLDANQEESEEGIGAGCRD